MFVCWPRKKNKSYFCFVTFKNFSIYIVSQIMMIENWKNIVFCLYFSSRATVMYAVLVLKGIFSTQPIICDEVFFV